MLIGVLKLHMLFICPEVGVRVVTEPKAALSISIRGMVNPNLLSISNLCL